MHEALDCARAGGTALMSVVGPQGVGKTRLLYEAAAVARRRGFRLLCGPFEAEEGQRPDRPVPTLVVVDESLCPDGRPAPAGSAGRPYSHTVWMTAHRPGASPTRSSAVGADISSCKIRLVLGPLSQSAVLHLASDLLDARPAVPLQRLLKQAGGHPRLLIELLQGLQEEGSIRTVAGVAQLVAPGLSEQARFYVSDILGQCSSLCRQLLCVMAVLDKEAKLEDLGLMLGTSTASLIVVLEEAYATGLIYDDGTQPAFSSVLARCLVAETVAPVLKTALRREAASLDRAHRCLPAARAAVAPSERHCDPPPDSSVTAPGVALSGQQLVLVRLVAEGLSNQEIAEHFTLSPHTINYHLRKLFRTFGVNSRIDLLNAVERAGLSWAADAGGQQ